MAPLRSAVIRIAPLLVLAALERGGAMLAGTDGRALAHAAYLWQLRWDDSVREAVDRMQGASSAPPIDEILVHAADILPVAGGEARALRGEIDAERLRRAGRPVGIVFRVGSTPASFAPEGPFPRRLAAIVVESLGRLRRAGVDPVEVQVDADCPTSRLAGYRSLLADLRRVVAPTPLTITLLPDWFGSPELLPLVRTTDGFVLQIHGVERPTPAGGSLLDVGRACRAVARASETGVPFRVALPTHEYLAAFDREGRILAVSAEDVEREWPPGTTFASLRAEPGVVAGLVRRWSADRPEGMVGFAWFRLPTRGDRRGWRWETFDAVRGGREPAPSIAVEREASADGRVDLALIGRGEGETGIDGVVVRWSRGRLLFAEPLGGFSWVPIGADGGRFVPPGGLRRMIRPGDRWAVGWLRFEPPPGNRRPEVAVEIESSAGGDRSGEGRGLVERRGGDETDAGSEKAPGGAPGVSADRNRIGRPRRAGAG
jgi:hypothetical protein